MGAGAADPHHDSPRPAQAPHTDQASNGESVPADAETGGSLRRQADEHPGSDPEASAEHADARRGEEPNGLHNGPNRRDEGGRTDR